MKNIEGYIDDRWVGGVWVAGMGKKWGGGLLIPPLIMPLNKLPSSVLVNIKRLVGRLAGWLVGWLVGGELKIMMVELEMTMHADSKLRKIRNIILLTN